MKDAIPAVLYLRMSSGQQELSLDQQTNELRNLAQRDGYAIVGVYEDAGKSGSKDTAKRPEFLRMINDASKGTYQAILVYDTSRFGRLNSIDVGPYVKLLQNANVILHSVREGKFDWRDEQGRIMWTLFAEANNRFSKGLSQNALRGRKDIASRGLWASGKVPFGFDRQYVDASGNKKELVKRSTPFKKARDWHLTLVENVEEADVVRHIFNEFATKDISLRELANQLNVNGYCCGGEMWTTRLLKLTLTNPAYIGRSYFGERSHKSMTAHNRAGKEHGKANACPSIIKDVKIWETVATILKSREENRTKPKTMSAGLLSGFVYCQCGRSMEKRKSHDKVTYVCARANKNKGSGCEFWSVDEPDLKEFIFGYLETNVSEELAKLAEARKTKKPENFSDVLRTKRDKLKREIENGRKNALFAEPELSQELFALLQEKVSELREVENALALSAEEPKEGWLKWWEQHRAEIMLLCQKSGYRVHGKDFAIPSQGSAVATDQDRLKGLFRHIGLRVQLTFGIAPKVLPKPRGRQKKWNVIRRELTVKIGEGKSDSGQNNICVGVNHHTTTATDILTILIAA